MAKLPDGDTLLVMLRNSTVRMVGENEIRLTRRQLGVLLIRCSHPEPLPAHAMATILNVDSVVIGRAGDALAAFGLAYKEPNPNDGRSVLPGPTEEGRALCRRLVAAELATFMIRDVSAGRVGPRRTGV
jgi:DNA-binding MarR family transcriptional regulator